MRARSVLALVCAAACSSYEGSDGPARPPEDAGADAATSDAATNTTSDAAPIDAAPTDAGSCDLAAPFGAPSAFPGVNTESDEATLRLSADESEAYFSRGSFASNTGDIFVATRAAGFQDAVVVPGVNHPSGGYADAFPNVTADGLEIFFGCNDDPTGPVIKRATRSSPTAPFGDRATVGSLPAEVFSPWLSRDGKSIYFGTVDGAHRIVRSVRVAGTFAAPIDVLPSAAGLHPVTTADELTLYYRGDDLRATVATRDSIQSVFTSAKRLDELPDGFAPSWVSADGCRLIGTLAVAGKGGDIVIAEKPKR